MESDRAIDGIFGFGQQIISVISQFASQGIAPRLFSHCLKGENRGRGILVLGQNVEPKCSMPVTPIKLSPPGLLQPISLPERIWEDIEGLQLSKGVNVILVVVDRLSKYSHFLTLKHPFTASDVAHKFTQEIIRLHGYPQSIISDTDKVFLSKFWRECFKASGTRLRFSTTFHPQLDGQTEVLNRCLETYLRCFASAHPKTWSEYLMWAEFWYNTSFHTPLQRTLFQVVYGREPPLLLRFEEGSRNNFELETMLRERDAILPDVKHHLLKAQEIMKNNADKHRRDLELVVGTMVYLKLRPYRQQSVQRRICQKLYARYYGPYEVLEKIGKVVYRLRLPVDSKIHPVFHVSQLKLVVSHNQIITPLPSTLSSDDELVVALDDIVDTRYDTEGHLEVLVTWKNLPPHETSWMRLRDFKAQFPGVSLEDKLVLHKGGIAMPLRVYTSRKMRKKNARIQEEKK